MVRVVYFFVLFALSIFLVVGLFATGHHISLSDVGQLKMILEGVVLFLTAVVMSRNQANVFVIILLVLTQLSLIDLYIEIIREYVSIGITLIFAFITGLTIFHILDRIRIIKQRT